LAEGAQVAVHNRGRVVANVAFGASHPDGNTITAATPFAVFSFSKAVVAVALFRLIADARVTLGDTGGTRVPEFAAAGEEGATVAQLLSHEAGVPALAGELAPEALV
jgi:CubicO group peptidase (beta-lactamase class C family)